MSSSRESSHPIHDGRLQGRGGRPPGSVTGKLGFRASSPPGVLHRAGGQAAAAGSKAMVEMRGWPWSTSSPQWRRPATSRTRCASPGIRPGEAWWWWRGLNSKPPTTARAHQRPLISSARAHRRGRARPQEGAVRLLRPRARAWPGRCHPDAQHRRGAQGVRLDQPRQGQPFDCRVLRALNFPYLGARNAGGVVYKARRARPARHARRAGTRRHLHGGGATAAPAR